MVKAAIIYDFDQTLCTKNMQEYSLLPALNVESNSFWQEVSKISKEAHMDPILAYMYLLLKTAKEKGKPLTRKFFQAFGKDIQYYPGVEEYFERINAYAASKGVELQHYVLSSGTKEIIEGSSVFSYFKRVYACEYHYDEQGYADWPALAINYTGKTQFLFRINKKALDVDDNSTINVRTPNKDILFENMIYIADGFTDVPCMRIVKGEGGTAIAIYKEKNEVFNQLIVDDRVNYCAYADYSKGSELDKLIHNLIDSIALKDELNKFKQSI